MSVKDLDIQAQIKERLDGWRINESVWDWIVRKTGIKPTIGGIESLAEKANISRTALRKLKKTQQHSLSREDLRNALAKYTYTIPGMNEPVKLGYYGYPPGYMYVEPRPALQQVYKEFSPQSLNESRQVGYQEPEVRYTAKQEEINNRIKSDFFDIIELAKFNPHSKLTWRSNIDSCEYCKSDKNSCSATDEKSQYIEGMLDLDIYVIYLSTHKKRLYGTAAIIPGKGFELQVEICENCIVELSGIFLIPISSLINKIMLRYNLSQPNVASEIGVPQVTISRLLNDKIDFIKPDLLKKLYDFWRFGPETMYKNEYWRIMPFILDEGLDNKPDSFLIEKMEAECDPWFPPWEDDWEFLIEHGAIAKHSGFTELMKSDHFDSVITYSEFLGMRFNSNEVYFEFRVKYSLNFWHEDGFSFQKASGILSVKYVLVDIKSRLLSEYFFFEIERLTLVRPDKPERIVPYMPDRSWWYDD